MFMHLYFILIQILVKNKEMTAECIQIVKQACLQKEKRIISFARHQLF